MKTVDMQYMNWKGSVSLRRILPHHVWYGKNEWHPEEQWLLRAFDIEKNAWRDFAFSGIQSWKPATDGKAQ
jgi:hypothetical protein